MNSQSAQASRAEASTVLFSNEITVTVEAYMNNLMVKRLLFLARFCIT
jgi:hypothetical protein